jgi:transcriptional regulator with XRE-family HTH domain
MEYRDIGENIRKYRRRLDLTQDELADKVGVTWEMISRYERGESSPMNKLDRIAQAFGVSITDLIDDSKDRSYNIPLFVKIPKNFSFDKENTTVFYNCPKWLIKLDPEVFAIDTDLIDKQNLISKEKGYIFISRHSRIENSDLVLVHDNGKLRVEKYKQNGYEFIGKVVMQEIIFADS